MIEPLVYWLMVAVAVANLVYTAVAARSKAARSELEDLRARIVDAGRRIEKLETELVHVPTKEQVHRLEVSLGQIEGATKVQAEILKSVQAGTSRVENYLLNNSRNS